MRFVRIISVLSLAASSLVLAAPANASGAASGASALAVGDFDNDGHDDLAVGVPGETRGPAESPATGTGAVNVFYGTDSGLSAARDQLIDQNMWQAEASETGDAFGSVVAAGDLNGDGYDDLAVGVPGEDLGPAGSPIQEAGAVNVFYGSVKGLRALNSEIWHQNVPGIKDSAEAGDEFGDSLAIGNFGRGGVADLAISAYPEDLEEESETVSGAGAVHTIYGSANGLRADGNDFFHQDTPGIADRAEDADGFAWSLAAGDVVRSDLDDLVLGVPYEDVGDVTFAGAVHVVAGSASGLDPSTDRFFHKGRDDIQGEPTQTDFFGFSVTIGNFGSGSERDLAVSAPLEEVGEATDAGVVYVLYGAGQGLSANGSEVWHQDTEGVADVAESSDFFGTLVLAANLGNGGQDDLIVGNPIEAYDGPPDDTLHKGVVQVIFGGSSGLTAKGNELWSEDVAGIPGDPGHDHFGESLMAGDFGKSGSNDLAAGAPLKAVPAGAPVGSQGAVNVIYGTAEGLRARGAQLWHQDVEGVKEVAAQGETFGDGREVD